MNLTKYDFELLASKRIWPDTKPYRFSMQLAQLFRTYLRMNIEAPVEKIPSIKLIGYAEGLLPEKMPMVYWKKIINDPELNIFDLSRFIGILINKKILNDDYMFLFEKINEDSETQKATIFGGFYYDFGMTLDFDKFVNSNIYHYFDKIIKNPKLQINFITGFYHHEFESIPEGTIISKKYLYNLLNSITKETNSSTALYYLYVSCFYIIKPEELPKVIYDILDADNYLFCISFITKVMTRTNTYTTLEELKKKGYFKRANERVNKIVDETIEKENSK